MSTPETVTAFIDAINSGNPEAVAALLSEDHIFVDSLGNRMEGRETMRVGWRFYFELFPDYRIVAERMLTENGTALVCGSASATLHRDGRPVDGGNWQIPAAWRAEVGNGKVREWQVYADNKPVYPLLES